MTEIRSLPEPSFTISTPRPFVFVLMPFNETFDDAYQLAIKPACDAAGAYAERVDEQVFEGSILERIYNQIAKADLIISDVSGHNANVFYETGYAHALGKLTLLVTQTAEDIPFDLKHYPHIVYGAKLGLLRNELEKRVRWHLSNPTKRQPNERLMSARVNDIFLDDAPTISIPVSGTQTGFELRVDLHNTVGRDIRTVDCQIGLLTPKRFVDSQSTGNVSLNVVAFSEAENLHLLGKTISLLPAGWATVRLWVFTDSSAFAPGEVHRFVLRIFTDSGFRDFPFDVRLTPKASGPAAVV